METPIQFSDGRTRPVVAALIAVTCFSLVGCQSQHGQLPRSRRVMRLIGAVQLPPPSLRTLRRPAQADRVPEHHPPHEVAGPSEPDSTVPPELTSAPFDGVEHSEASKQGNKKAQVDPETTVAADESDEVTTSEQAEKLLTDLGVIIRRDEQGRIRGVDAAYQKFSDRHAATLPLLGDLTELNLTGTDITDPALKVISQISTLESLKLKGTSTSDAGLPHLTPLKQLRLLDLGRTDISDSAVTQLLSLKKLEYLLLNHTQVSDQAVEHLQSLQTLRGLNLIDTRVSAEGLARLEQALPECLVISETGNVGAIQAPPEFGSASGSVASMESTLRHDPRLQQLSKLAAQDPSIAAHLALVYSRSDRWVEAALILQAAAKARPSDRNLQYRLADALARAGHTDDAYQIFDQVAGESVANYAIGVIVFEDALARSEAYLRRSLESDPHNTKARQKLNALERSRSTTTGNRVSTASLPKIVPRNSN